MDHIKIHLSLYVYEILMVFLGGVLEGGEVDQKGGRRATLMNYL